MCIGLGIGMGYHRLHTHRSYKVPKLLEYFFAICGALTLEGGPIFWVATHRLHHQHSDTDSDPHTPHHGGFWAHMGWILFGEGHHNDTELMSRYAPDLAADPFYRWLNTWHWVPLTVFGFVVLALGGWPMVFWLVFFRVTVGLHATWLVNSATHMWGGRRFDDQGRLEEQLVGRDADLRRGLAQQPPCPSDVGTSRARLVRSRPHLDPDSPARARSALPSASASSTSKGAAAARASRPRRLPTAKSQVRSGVELGSGQSEGALSADLPHFALALPAHSLPLSTSHFHSTSQFALRIRTAGYPVAFCPMISAPKRKSLVFALLGACLAAAAVALNVGWVVINWREGLLFIIGIILFPIVITGVVLNTIFLVREVRRSEQHDAFINAVTHELKTPVASIRLYLETLERRDLPDEKRREFYRVMMNDSDRLLQLVEQVLRAGKTSARVRVLHQVPIDLREMVPECLELARSPAPPAPPRRWPITRPSRRPIRHACSAIPTS